VTTTRNILVIGGGPAGTFAAIAAKKQDPAAAVTLLSDEHCEPYEKPPLSKGVLLGKVLPSDALIAGPAGLASHQVLLERRATCVAIDREQRVAVLEDGRRLPYDGLVLATGSLPREIPLVPLGMPGVYYLRTEADAEALKSALGRSRDLLVVGGGLIGLEVAASAAELGVRTTVVEMLPRILARVCDDDTGALVHEAHRQHGVEIRVGTALSHVSRDGDGRMTAATTSGERLTADIVVVGTGAKPNDRLAADAGLATDDGIVVDEYCQTSDPAIFAAGDAVRFPGPLGLVRLENWRHAQDQGAVAGRNAAGAHEAYTTLPSFWSEQYDLYIQGVGWPRPGTTRVRRPLSAPGAVLVFEVLDGVITYAMGINAQRELAAVRRLIERKVTADPSALADPAVALQSLLKR
jgi:NADPH-dependent 2,4-dienoyl-CoA reductase/sulfur reductase-like enzyme